MLKIIIEIGQGPADKRVSAESNLAISHFNDINRKNRTEETRLMSRSETA